MSEKLLIFNEPNFDDSISREEYHTYHPQTKSFENSDEIEISINQQDVFLSMNDAALFISGKFIPQPNAEGVTGDCKLTNNAGAFLFESITYLINGKEIDRVRDPGIVATLKGYLCYSPEEIKTLNIAGWINHDELLETLNVTDNKFTFRIPLHFLLGVFHDYTKVIRGKQTIKLVRARTDKNCYRSTGSREAKIELTNVELKVKHIIPNDLLKLQLLDNINNDKPILISFRKWDFHELPALRTTTSDVWTVKTSTALERPRFVIVAFQTDRKDNAKDDATLFDHLKITDMKLYLNSECYPYENLQVDFDSWHYTEIYQMYLDFQRNFLNKTYVEPFLSYAQFKNRPLFVIDCSKQEESIQATTVDIKLEFRSKEPFKDNTKAFCIIIHDSITEYKPLSGLVRYIN